MGKVSDRTALTGAAAAVGDLFPIVDVSATTAGSKKMTTVELLNLICSATINSTAMTGSGAHASQDFLLYSDNGVAKSITMSELFAAIVTLGTAITSGFHATEDHLLYSDNGVNKKITMANALTALLSLAGATLTGANSATDDTFPIYDLDATAAKSITRAELEIAIRNAATAARVVNLAATSLSVTQALHDGRIVKLSHTGAASTATLPVASGSGAVFTFIVGAVNTSNHVIKVTGDDVMKGLVTVLDNDGTAVTGYSATGTDDTITLNGTTTGGAIGDRIELVDIAADTWAVRGFVTVPTGSDPADMFSATV